MSLKKTRATSAMEEWKTGHFAWTLCGDSNINVKLEEIPPGGGSDAHFHQLSTQFFFVLEGRAHMTVGDESCELEPHEGVLVEPWLPHLILNSGEEPLTFLLVSQPAVAPEDVFG